MDVDADTGEVGPISTPNASMDAAELHAYKHLGVYIIFPASGCRYRSSSGTKLVQTIPELPDEFDEWLRRKRRDLTRLLEEMKDRGFNGYCELSREPPVNSEKIKQVCTIDLDSLVFSVDNGAHFKLDSIPRGLHRDEWLHYLGQDGTGHRCLKPSLSQTIAAVLQPQTDLDATMKDTRKYHSLHAKLVSPRDLASDATEPEFACQEISATILEALVGEFYGTLCNACQYEPSDPQFQRCAQWLLRAAAPNFLQLHLNGEAIAEPSPQSSRCAIECTNRVRQGVFFRFRGCLVLLSTRLDSDVHVRANVVRVVSRVREKNIRSDIAIIWSIRHVVIVRISGDEVVHTAALPVLAAYGVGDFTFTEGVRLLASCLRPACKLRERDESTPAQRDVATSRERSIRDDSQGRETAFSNSETPMPTDILLEIMKYVDVETYSNVFSRLTQATRAVWMQSTRVGPYMVCGLMPKWRELMCFDVNLNYEGRGCQFVAYDETGHRIELSLVYEGHQSLGVYSPAILRARHESHKREELCMRWPQLVDENREKAQGIEGRLEVRPSGLYVTVV